jgi:hypothetical protein
MAHPKLIGMAALCAGALLLGLVDASPAADKRVHRGAVRAAAAAVVVPAAGISGTLVAGVEQFGPYFYNPYYGYGLSYGPPYNGVAVYTGLFNR